MPFIFTISKQPNVGDEVTVSLIDGNGVERDYDYTVQENDSLQDIVDALETEINGDTFFVAVPQTTYADPGLSITQVATVNYGGFSGEVSISYSENSFSPAQTLSFDEETNAFESFLSYLPEMMTTIGPLLVTFKNGDLWTHDSETYNSFYGVEYQSFIEVVFNDNLLLKKQPQSISEVSSSVWDCPAISTNVSTYGTTKQQTSLVEAEFTVLEGNPSASIKRDANSPGGKINGNFMKGNYVIVRFRKQTASGYEYLNTVSLYYTQSQLTKI